MAKCPICNSRKGKERKGKRKCLIADDFICSQCCGNTRTEEACLECTYYQKPKRKYNEVPSYSISDMDGNMELESYGNSIEGALCAYDVENQEKLKDCDAIKIIELLIDKYHYQDQKLDQENDVIANGVSYVDKSIMEDMKDVENHEIVKVLGGNPLCCQTENANWKRIYEYNSSLCGAAN